MRPAGRGTEFINTARIPPLMNVDALDEGRTRPVRPPGGVRRSEAPLGCPSNVGCCGEVGGNRLAKLPLPRRWLSRQRHELGFVVLRFGPGHLVDRGHDFLRRCLVNHVACSADHVQRALRNVAMESG